MFEGQKEPSGVKKKPKHIERNEKRKKKTRLPRHVCGVVGHLLLDVQNRIPV